MASHHARGNDQSVALGWTTLGDIGRQEWSHEPYNIAEKLLLHVDRMLGIRDPEQRLIGVISIPDGGSGPRNRIPWHNFDLASTFTFTRLSYGTVAPGSKDVYQRMMPHCFVTS